MSRSIPRAIPLTNTVMNRLSERHGSHEAAWATATRGMMPFKPKKQADQGTLEHRVVVINDLHIGPGFDPVMEKYDASDDFTAAQERQFAAWMANEWAAAGMGNENLTHPTKTRVAKTLSSLKWANGSPVNLGQVHDLQGEGKYALTLNINGDFLDFLQTMNPRPNMPFPDGVNKDGAPLNTPANSIVVLNTIREGHPEVFKALAVHLLLGHNIDLVPGNHDRHFWNEHVWEGEIEVAGQKLGGFTKIMAEELREFGANPAEVKEALGRLERKAFAVYADKWVDHGDMADRFNRVQRPLKELFEPSGMHEEMQMALGDYGVRGGFNQLEPLDPSLDAIDSTPKFLKHALRHPKLALGLVKAFLRGTAQAGYTTSMEAEKQDRITDMHKLVEQHPYIMEQLNALRPEGEKLTKEEVKTGLGAVENQSATPLFSNFRKGTNTFLRLLKLGRKLIRGKADKRDKHEINLDRGLAAQKHLGINGIVEGHTHHAKFDTYLTTEEKGFQRMNTHTWMSKEGSWGRPDVTWGEDGRGVGVIEVGTNKDGERWTEMRLEKVVSEDGGLVRGDLYADAEVDDKDPKRLSTKTDEIFDANAGHVSQKKAPAITRHIDLKPAVNS